VEYGYYNGEVISKNALYLQIGLHQQILIPEEPCLNPKKKHNNIFEIYNKFQIPE
jgi:hypothetical protein